MRIQRPGREPQHPEHQTRQPGGGKSPGWLLFCEMAGVDPLVGVLEEHIALWARGMEAAGLAPATRARRLAAVSSWYRWLVRGGHVQVNPAANLPRPNIDPDTSLTPGLTRAQALALLDAADRARGPQAPRNRAIIAIYLYTGIRVSELIGADVASLGINRGHRVLKVTRKGGHVKPVVLPPPAATRMDEYLAGRSDVQHVPAIRGAAAAAPVPLIVTKTGRRVLAADLWQLIRRLGKAAGFPDELTRKLCNHGMRHTFATLALDAGTPLRDLQDAMDHRDPRTTRRYDHSRGRLDRSPGYALAAFLAAGQTGEGQTDGGA